MKKLYFFAIVLLAPVFLNAQICVTQYDGTDFGLNDVESYINVLEIDSMDNVWFGLRKTNGDGLGLGRFENNVWMEINNPSIVPDPRINDIAFDAFDSVWVATENGISVFHRLSFQGRVMNTSNSSLPFANVTAVTVDRQGRVWAGFEFGHIAIYNGVFWQVIKEWPNLMVYDLAVDQDNYLWIALDGIPGIVVFKDTAWIHVPEVGTIKSLKPDKWGRMLAMNQDSLMIFNGLTYTNIVKPEPGVQLLDVAVGPMGDIWASTKNGLLARSGDTFVRYGNHNSAVPAEVSGPISFNSMGQLWFGFNYMIGAVVFSGTGFLYLTADPQQDLVTSDKPGMEFCDGDSLTLTAEDGSSNYIWPDGVNDNSYVLYDGEVVMMALERENQCYFYDTVTVRVQKVYEEEKVCAVSVDSTGSILVIWEKTADMGTQSFNIYRENDTNAWDFVANIPMNRLSVFEDWNADPRLRSQRYKISCVDTCGNESGQSFYHNTLLLTSTYGDLTDDVRLMWNQYDSVEYFEYIIYSGPWPDQMKEVARVPKDVQTYVFENVLDTLYFQIAIELPAECAPEADLKAGTGPYTHSLSNLDDNRKLITQVSDPESIVEIRAYPNPFRDMTKIEFSNPGQSEYQLSVYNLEGKKVREIRQITNSEIILTRGDLKTGFYVFELRGENTYRGKFVVR
ncbi:MAG: T9SS type A sorting domain-containing protein [Bacteroidales bacterium]|nr:T9SS type A sorting domain-containing protein [Bacteroidales bacterium]